MKRFFDLVISSFGLLLVSPIFVLVFLSVFIILGRPIFFIQKRSGYKKNGFYLIKFRTMLENKKDSTVDDEIRLTKFGSFLRSYSLDELPALFNVLRGDMSIVGPRPLLYEYLELYDDFQIKRDLIDLTTAGLSLSAASKYLAKKNNIPKSVIYNMY